MKSYTDLEQSKALAKILPVESADMCWIKIDDDESFNGSWEVISRNSSLVAIDDKPLLCWSLAALLNVIPQEIFDGEYIINITEGCDSRWVLTYDNYENENPSYYGLSAGADTLVDAFYELILKLYERKLL